MVVVNIPGSNFNAFAQTANGWIVLDIVDEPDGSESADASYLVSATGLGIFEGKSNNIAILTANQGWYFIAPRVGLQATVISSGLFLRWNGTAWQDASAGGGSSGLSDRTVSALSGAVTVTGDDNGGVIWVDGAHGAFTVAFDPTILPGMKVLIKRKDSSPGSTAAVTVTGEGGASRAVLTSEGDWAYLASHNNGSSQVVDLIASGSPQ